MSANVLTSNQKRALAAILASKSLVAASQACGLSEKTLQRYLTDQRFRAALAAAESDVIDQATRRLLALTGLAVDTLDRVLTDPAARDAVTLRAAQMVIDGLLRLRELAIEKRISELESAVYSGKSKH